MWFHTSYVWICILYTHIYNIRAYCTLHTYTHSFAFFIYIFVYTCITWLAYSKYICAHSKCEPYRMEKEPCKILKEPYVKEKEPCKIWKEPYRIEIEPCKMWKEPYGMEKEPCMIRKKHNIKQTDIYMYEGKEHSPVQCERISWQRLCPPLYMAVFTWQRAFFFFPHYIWLSSHDKEPFFPPPTEPTQNVLNYPFAKTNSFFFPKKQGPPGTLLGYILAKTETGSQGLYCHVSGMIEKNSMSVQSLLLGILCLGPFGSHFRENRNGVAGAVLSYLRYDREVFGVCSVSLVIWLS